MDEMTTPTSTAVDLIAAERQRQIETEGWTPEHDAGYGLQELVDAAHSYLVAEYFPTVPPRFWPWDRSWWKPTPDDRVRELVKAGALIAAEIDRRLRSGAP